MMSEGAEKEPTIRIEYDDDALAVVDKINGALEIHGISIRDDGLEHDGFCIFTIERIDAPRTA